MDWLLHIIEVCNNNDGFVMGLLTFVYVAATILICRFNFKSAKAASDQIEASNLIQKQNIDIQLFEMRKKLICDLEEALAIKVQYFTKKLRGSNTEEKYEEKVITLLRELPYLFKKDDFEFVYQANDCLNEIQRCLIEYNKKYSEFVFVFFRDDYEEKLKKFKDVTKDFLDNVIDESNYKSISNSVDAKEMCECIIVAKQKYFEALELLDKNDIENVFKTKYLSFK